MEMLKPGMRLVEALHTLGLEGLPSGTRGSGPARHFGYRIPLGTNRILMVVCDTSQTPLDFQKFIFEKAVLYDEEMRPVDR